MINVQFQRLDPRAIVPTYAHATDAGADLYCLDDFELEPGQRKLIGTGIAIALPQGYVGLVHPRSGLAHKNGISIVNAPGTIDADYRGEIFINLINLDLAQTFRATAGSRIAQLVIQEFVSANFTEVLNLPDSIRGEKGHGSTGVKN